MDLYPLNLIFAIAVASATIFLGFLSTKNISSEFFARQIFLAIFAWAIIGLASPSAISHYHFIIAFLCFASWWKFRADHALGGKMWLSIASGLGISIGIMLLLAVTPRAYPPNLPQLGQHLLLASIYLGGAVIGLAYVCYVMTEALSGHSGITHDQVQRYINLLAGLVIARAAVLLALIFLIPGHFTSSTLAMPQTATTEHFFGYEFTFINSGVAWEGSLPIQTLLLLILVILILPALVFIARRTTHVHSQSRAIPALLGICLVGILAEVLARLLVL